MNKSNFQNSNESNYVRYSAQVFVVGMILSLTFFLLLVDSYKTYRSDVSIIVIAKTENANIQQKQLVANVLELPRTLMFYDRLLKFNPNVRDVAAGLTPDQRKAAWNKMFSISSISPNASVLKISLTAGRETDSQKLANKTVRTLFDTMAFYYNVKDDVNLSIVEGPITKSQILGWPWLLLISMLGGFVLATLLNLLVFGSKRKLKDNLFERKSFFDFNKKANLPVEEELESLYREEQAEEPFIFEQENEELEIPAEKFQEVKRITKQLEPGKYPNFPEMPARNATHSVAGGPIRETRQASAPDNLPIGDDLPYFPTEVVQENVSVEEKPVEIAEPKIDTHKEPTPAELKKRLNDLLSGKF